MGCGSGEKQRMPALGNSPSELEHFLGCLAATGPHIDSVCLVFSFTYFLKVDTSYGGFFFP